MQPKVLTTFASEKPNLHRAECETALRYTAKRISPSKRGGLFVPRNKSSLQKVMSPCSFNTPGFTPSLRSLRSRSSFVVSTVLFTSQQIVRRFRASISIFSCIDPLPVLFELPSFSSNRRCIDFSLPRLEVSFFHRWVGLNKTYSMFHLVPSLAKTKSSFNSR